MKILGISAYYHDSAAAIIEDGKVIVAAQEERFSRVKNDAKFPKKSIEYCLEASGIELNELDAVVFYEKPLLKFERILQNYLSNAPLSLISFIVYMPNWLKEKLFLKQNLRKSLKEIDSSFDSKECKLLFSEHHLSHAASAFFCSPYSSSLVLVMDGVGEYATTSVFQGAGNQIIPLYEQHFPDSIGLLYSSITQFLGFEVNNGEYKIMGLAPYASDADSLTIEYIQKIKEHLVTIHDDGSIEMNKKYFLYTKSLRMIHKRRFENLFACSMRKSEDELTKQHAAIAQAIQKVTEEIVLKTIRFAQIKHPNENLCLAGGVALNCVLNGKIKESNLFKNIFIQPAAGDAGGSIGAALSAYHQHFEKERPTNELKDMNSMLLGPSFKDDEIRKILLKKKIPFQELSQNELLDKLADGLVNGKIVGNFRGKMEFGPRALGNRSILGNPLIKDVQLQLNLKIKKRESFRPFAPILLMEDFEKYFGQKYESPYMLMVHPLKEEYRLKVADEKDLFQQVQQQRSQFPGITHVDYSSRIQTVTNDTSPFLHNILLKFKEKAGVGILINTSFNIKDEPIVCTPVDAINCFKSTEMDILVLNNFWIEKWNL